ncbi:MAG: hypothetical protein IKU77_07400 [Alistipes sp.]|nr:hypothetical protein [Alistipes sp.]
MTRTNEHLRKSVLNIEAQLREIVGNCIGKWFASPRCDYEYEPLVELLHCRKVLLDEMFIATVEEVERMEQVNACLRDLTNKLFARTEELYRKMISTTYVPEFDDDVDVEGTLKFEMNDTDSILSMSNDDYYGSDFAFVFEVIACLYTHNYLRREEIEFSYCYCPPNSYRADMDREELRTADNLNDDNTWYESSQPAADKLSHLCICHAIYDLNMHKPYSIPDILRMNDFMVEVTVKHQHFATTK